MLAQEWARAQRLDRPLALAMVDVDWFKAYDDHYGHPAGDACLREVARTLAIGYRSSDLVARYGGEEFVVLVPTTDLEGALSLACKVVQAVEALGIVHESSPWGHVQLRRRLGTNVP